MAVNYHVTGRKALSAAAEHARCIKGRFPDHMSCRGIAMAPAAACYHSFVDLLASGLPASMHPLYRTHCNYSPRINEALVSCCCV